MVRFTQHQDGEIIGHNRLLIKELKNNFYKKKPSILDYGGGVGISYMVIKDDFLVDYTVVEVEKICEAGQSIWKNEVKFYSTTNFEMDNLDILYIKTSLQYAQNWKSTLENLLSFSPKTIILTDTACGNIPTFLTTQKWKGNDVLYWFISDKELIELVKNFGYKLVLNEPCTSINSQFTNIPDDHILKESLNLILKYE